MKEGDTAAAYYLLEFIFCKGNPEMCQRKLTFLD